MTPITPQSAALAAFVECVVARLNPTLNAHTAPHNGEGEYEILVGAGGAVLHESIEQVLAIATRNGGRAFVAPEGTEDANRGRLCIVWPGRVARRPS